MAKTTYIDDYLKLHESISLIIVEVTQRPNKTHFEAPHNFCENTDVRVVGH